MIKKNMYAFCLILIVSVFFSCKESVAPVENANNTALLKTLHISAGTLTPAFTPECFNYTVSVPFSVSSITVTAEAMSSGSEIRYTPNKTVSLNPGANNIAIAVTSGSTHKIYYITVHRTAPGSNTDLQSVTVSAGALTPAFSPSVTSYNVVVPSNTLTFTVTAIPVDTRTTVTYSPSQTITLDDSGNLLIIVSRAENGASKNTMLTIRKAANNNADLKSLVCSEGTLIPGFDPAVTTYKIYVPATTGSITLTGTAANNKAKVKYLPSKSPSLASGENHVTVEVTAADEVTKKEYRLVIYRADDYISEHIGKLVKINRNAPATFKYHANADALATITKPYRIAETEITRKQFNDLMGFDPSNTTISATDTSPVQMVSWYEALVFCNKLSKLEGLSPVYSINSSTNPDDWGAIPTTDNPVWESVQANWNVNGYRLPTRMEWLYAALAEQPYTISFSGSNGINHISDYAWYAGNSSNKAHPVKTKNANQYRLYDMTGNVAEWCWDIAKNNGHNVPGTVTDYRGEPSGFQVLIMGQSYGTTAGPHFGVSDTHQAERHTKLMDLGFRVAQTVN